MYIKRKFKVPVFDQAIIIHVTDEIDIASRELECSPEEIIHIHGAVYKDYNDRINVLFNLEASKNINTVTHECLHIVKRIMEDVGIPIGKKTEEVEAYLLGYITEKVTKILDKIN